MKRSKKKPVYTAAGEALDQETIVRLRPLIESYVRDDLKKNFQRSDLSWNMNKKKNFNFTIKFYA